ncbi:GDP-6-deoxy-D-mannose reductase [anaerobic digester metagenome]
MLNGKKVFVTGAGGFIGSHLTEELVRANADVTAMIRYGSSANWGNLEFLPSEIKREIRVVAGNVEDSDFMMHSLKGQDIVFHLAALIAIPYSYVAPRSYVRTNVEGTLNVMEAVRRLGIGRVVHTSTSEVYGTALFAPIDESHPLQGQSPYSASKIGADKIAESYYLSFATPVVTLRPFNTYGPRQSARAFIPTVISQALEQRSIRMGSLDPQRDMTFVRDTALGFVAAGTISGIEGETINLGVGHTDSIGAIAGRILSLMNCQKEIEQDPSRLRPAKSEVLKLLSNNEKAKKLLGWAPITSLDDGLMETIEFVRSNINLFKSNSYNI